MALPGLLDAEDGVTRSVARARAREVDALVAEIAERMVSGKWVAGRSHRELAEREGATVDAVEKWASDAGRMLRMLSPAEREDLRARNAARLDMLYDMAVSAVEVVRTGDGEAEIVPQPDVRAAVSALAEQGKLLGLNAAEKHVVAHVDPELPEDPRERLALLRQTRAAIDEGIAQCIAAIGFDPAEAIDT